jgi:hypothetical protein
MARPHLLLLQRLRLQRCHLLRLLRRERRQRLG